MTRGAAALLLALGAAAPGAAAQNARVNALAAVLPAEDARPHRARRHDRRDSSDSMSGATPLVFRQPGSVVSQLDDGPATSSRVAMR